MNHSEFEVLSYVIVMFLCVSLCMFICVLVTWECVHLSSPDGSGAVAAVIAKHCDVSGDLNGCNNANLLHHPMACP